MSAHMDAPKNMARSILMLEQVMVVLFVLEFAVAILALGPRLYLSEAELVLDFVLLGLTLSGFVFNVLQNLDSGVHRACTGTVCQDENYRPTSANFFDDDTARGLKLARVAQLLRMLYKEPRTFKIMVEIFRTVRARPGRLSGLSVLHSKSVFVWRFCMGMEGA